MSRTAVAPVAAYIGLGSNLGDPVAQLRAALRALAALPDTHLSRASGLYANPPLGPVAQPEFVNAVAALETTLDALDLLAGLREIEQAQGRERHGERWGPRTLDLDLLLYGAATIHAPTLTVPHSGLPVRNFVLYPLAEVAPADLVVPGLGTLGDLLAACPRGDLRRIEGEP